MHVTTSCPICDGSGLRVTIDDRGNRLAHDCSCRIEQRVERVLAKARIPKRYLDCSLANYETAHSSAHSSLGAAAMMAGRFCAAFPLETRGHGILFIGSSGLGKTHLAVSILRCLIAEKGATGQFWEHKELLDKLRSIYSLRTAGAEDRLLRSVITCDLLVLDDLGEITPSDWSWDTTAYILNSRYNESLSTIITTNLANEPAFATHANGEEPSSRADLRRAARRETLGDRIGERMRSRLQEMCVPVELFGNDFRQTVKRATFS